MSAYKFERVFNTFKKHHEPIPLVVFENSPYKILVSTLLSSRTKDETTLAASKRLFKKAPSVYKLKNLETYKLKNLIYPVGFYNTKAKHLKKLARIIVNDFSGKIPDTRGQLIKLPGVGRKTANLVLNRTFGKNAIAVDTHVHKISNLLGWVDTKTPEQTERQLAKILPKKYWPEINHLFVSIGRQFTTKKKLEAFLRKEKLI